MKPKRGPLALSLHRPAKPGGSLWRLSNKTHHTSASYRDFVSPGTLSGIADTILEFTVIRSRPQTQFRKSMDRPVFVSLVEADRFRYTLPLAVGSGVVGIIGSSAVLALAAVSFATQRCAKRKPRSCVFGSYTMHRRYRPQVDTSVTREFSTLSRPTSVKSAQSER